LFNYVRRVQLYGLHFLGGRNKKMANYKQRQVVNKALFNLTQLEQAEL
jgi:hypothetical protein